MYSNREMFGLLNNFSMSRFNFGGFFTRLSDNDDRFGLSSRIRNRLTGSDSYQKPGLTLEKPAEPTINIKPEIVSQPQDSISPDLGNRKNISEPVVYTKPQMANNSSETDETTPAEGEGNGDEAVMTSHEREWINLVTLSMKFNLSDFERMVTTLAQDAEDGQLETTTLNNLRIGLSTDLNVKALVNQKVTYDNPEALDQSDLNRSAGYSVGERNAMSMKLQSRQFKAAAFYRDSMSKSFQLDKSYSDGFLRISRKMSMRYTQDFSFNYRSLQKFSQQATGLENSGNTEQYLNTTEALLDNQNVGGELIGDFFNMVDDYMGQAEDQLLGKIDDFFNELSSQVGIESRYTAQTKELLVSSVTSFFDKVEAAVNTVESRYIAPTSEITEQINSSS